MYNLSNLNDYEFEILCKDIMEYYLKTKLHRFKKGQDGGIDLCDSNKKIKYMIQVKHYINSKFSDLKTHLINEIENVKRENPDNYYVCTSIELSPHERNEILKLFPNYMKDKSFIIDKTDIDDFLSKEEHMDIVKRNYKLWLCSTNVLSIIQNKHIFIDCEELIDDIENISKLFVSTNSYFKCLEILKKRNVLIITGTPGVGKTTISKMLLLNFINDGYIVRYATDNNLKDIKTLLSNDESKKEIILLDDFLGQHYLNLSEKEPNQLKSLIYFVEKNQNKKIIMNSRITILNEAYRSSLIFASLFDRYEKENFCIDLNKMSYLEKAQILYNHLYFNNLPSSYLDSIRNNKNYIEIVKHKNYNPRIIEFATKEKNYKQINPDNYSDYIFSKLDNPNSVWEDEFRNRITEIDRIYMNTLYSLTNDKVEIKVLENAFNKRIMQYYNDTTLNIFDEITNRLNNSLIKIVFNRRKRYISVINPSVNDYLNRKINKNKNEQINIINNAYYIEQVEKFKINKNIILEKIYNNEISHLYSYNNNIPFFYFEFILEYELKDIKLSNFLRENFKKLCSLFYYKNEDIIISLLEKGYIDYYNLYDVIFDKLKDFLFNLSYKNLLSFIQILKEFRKDLSEMDKNIIKSSFEIAINEYIVEDINDFLNDIVESNIGRIDFREKDLDEVNDNIYNEYYDSIEEDIIQNIRNDINQLIKETPIEIDINEIDENYILSQVNIDSSIRYYVEKEYDRNLYTSNLINSTKEKNTNWSEIDQIFS